MNNRSACSHLLLFAGLLLVLASCTQTSSPPQTSAIPTVDSAHLTAFVRDATSNASSTPIPTPIVASAANVGPAPKDCPLDPPLRPQKLSDNIAPLVGTSPVWATAGGGSGPGHLAGDTWSPDGGWPGKIVWEVGPNYNRPVILLAGNLRDGTFLQWHFPEHQLTWAPVLDPQHPGHPVSVIGPEWNEWGSEILIPAAGCYYVEAIWPEGHWRVTFAVGL
jgi:hypothetical protein